MKSKSTKTKKNTENKNINIEFSLAKISESIFSSSHHPHLGEIMNDNTFDQLIISWKNK